MYYQLLALIDCSEDSRRLAAAIAAHFSDKSLCKVTIAANVGPSPSPEIREKKVKHALEALENVYDILLGSGLMARRRVVLECEDPVSGVLAELGRAEGAERAYDLIVLGTHHARTEEFEAPCRGSFADRMALRSPIPVMVLPTR